MQELSVSVTFGSGAEHHNHTKTYRLALDHVLPIPNGVLELIPYEDYASKINYLLKDAIDAYNSRQQDRYAAAVERYKEGKRKSKPYPKDYPPMSYEYAQRHASQRIYNPNRNCIEMRKLYRGLIIKISNIKARVTGILPDDVAQEMGEMIITRMAAAFPLMCILGATLHSDEWGAVHIHIDYMMISERHERNNGLPVSLGFNAAMQSMGYHPEISIMHAKIDRPPLLFNAFRNAIYKICEAVLYQNGFRMQYDATAKNYPYLDPSQPRSLAAFQYASDYVRWYQHCRNKVLDMLQSPEMQPNDLLSAIDAYKRMTDHVINAQTVSPEVSGFAYAISEELLFCFHATCVQLVQAEIQAANALNCQIDSSSEALQELMRVYRDLSDYYAELQRKANELEQTIETLNTWHKQLLHQHATVSVPKSYNAKGYRRITWREYHTLLRIAECAEALTDENARLKDENLQNQANLNYWIQCCARMEELLRQYNPIDAERDIQRIKRDLSGVQVTDYCHNQLLQIARAKDTLEAQIRQASDTVASISAAVNQAKDKELTR